MSLIYFLQKGHVGVREIRVTVWISWAKFEARKRTKGWMYTFIQTTVK